MNTTLALLLAGITAVGLGVNAGIRRGWIRNQLLVGRRGAARAAQLLSSAKTPGKVNGAKE